MMLSPPADAINIKDFVTWMGNDGICRTKVKKGADIDLVSAIENTKAVDSFYIGKHYPIIIDSSDIHSMSREARKHFSTNGRVTSINSMAIVVSSPISKVIGNFFLGLNKPEVPARLFNNEKEALVWLKEQNLVE